MNITHTKCEFWGYWKSNDMWFKSSFLWADSNVELFLFATPTSIHFQTHWNFVEFDIKYAIPPFFIRCIFHRKLLLLRNVKNEEMNGCIVKLSKNDSEMTFTDPVDIFTNLKMNLADVDGNLSVKHFYGKIIRLSDENKKMYTIRFTSVPPEIEAYFKAIRSYHWKLEMI